MYTGYEGGEVVVLAAGCFSEGNIHIPVGVDSSLHDMDTWIILLLQAQLLPTGWATSITITITG